MIKRAAFILVAAFSLFFGYFLNDGLAADVPAPRGDIYVQDFVGVLSSEQKAELNQLGRNLENGTSAQISTLIIDSLEGESIEEYANKAFRQYGIGSKKENNGVLLVLAMDDHKIRIEVGYGLEGALPDGKVGRIMDQFAVPYLKNNEPDQAVIQTYKVLYNETAAEYNWDGETAKAIPYKDTTDDGMNPIVVILGVIGLVILIFLDMKFFGGTLTHLLLMIISRGGGGGRGGDGPRGGGGGSSGGGGASRGW
ncbi:TPM domain-containing protein [Bacillus massiliigorillae]|uniref:TPM domain-containing protein n=1 Tax=Bacillus massiliigorillae TaxID=1243664 RepID=UPI0003AB1FA1|nr:TPM domain-containing protein [Bacillus massiliigorillae]